MLHTAVGCLRMFRLVAGGCGGVGPRPVSGPSTTWPEWLTTARMSHDPEPARSPFGVHAYVTPTNIAGQVDSVHYMPSH